MRAGLCFHITHHDDSVFVDCRTGVAFQGASRENHAVRLSMSASGMLCPRCHRNVGFGDSGCSHSLIADQLGAFARGECLVARGFRCILRDDFCEALEQCNLSEVSMRSPSVQAENSVPALTWLLPRRAFVAEARRRRALSPQASVASSPARPPRWRAGVLDPELRR